MSYSGTRTPHVLVVLVGRGSGGCGYGQGTVLRARPIGVRCNAALS
jgi:hypothetical protein